MRTAALKSKPCKACGKRFTPQRAQVKYCSEKCRLTVYGPRPKVTRRCWNCRDEFETSARRPQDRCKPCRDGTRFTEDEEAVRAMENLSAWGLKPEAHASLVEYTLLMHSPKRRRLHQQETRSAADVLRDDAIEFDTDHYREWRDAFDYCLDARDEIPAGSMIGHSLRAEGYTQSFLAKWYPGYGDGYGVPSIVARAD